MARGKKKERILAPDDKLKEALVPESEWPYKVPENWRWVYLGETSEIIMGQSPDGSSTTNDTSYMPLIGGAADMGEMYPKASRYTKKPTKVSKTNDVILCIRATLGRPIFSDGQYCLGRGVAALRSNAFIKEFVRFAAINYEQYLYDNATGTTFAQVSSNTLKKMPIPLPPLPEQQRIVDRIESLFAKLDEAKEKAQAVVDGFEDRRTMIIHKAFTGELTANWRCAHNISLTSWRQLTLDDVADYKKGPFGSSITKAMFVPKGEHTYKVYEQGNAIRKTLDYGHYYISEQKYSELKGFAVKGGDIIISCAGTIGEVYKLPEVSGSL